MIANTRDVAAEEFAAGSRDGMRAKGTGEFDGKSTSKARTGVEAHTQRIFVLGTKGASNVGNLRKRRQRNIKRWFFAEIDRSNWDEGLFRNFTKGGGSGKSDGSWPAFLH